MGDLFHDSSSTQTATNKQVGVQGGGAGSTTIGIGSENTVNLVDPGAFKLAHDTLEQQAGVLHDVLGANATIALGALAAGQNTATAATLAIQQTAHDAFDLVHSSTSDAINAAVTSSPSAQVGEIAAGAAKTQRYLVIAAAVAGLVVLYVIIKRR